MPTLPVEFTDDGDKLAGEPSQSSQFVALVTDDVVAVSLLLFMGVSSAMVVSGCLVSRALTHIKATILPYYHTIPK
jgi:hypothetical protein